MKKLKYLFLSALCLVMISIQSCRKESSPVTESSQNPTVQKLEPSAGAANTILTLTGDGIGDIRRIYFDKDTVNAGFNPVFNTDGAILFRVPTDAVPGQQNIVLINGAGKQVSVPFNVLGLATITDVSNYNFSAGATITLTGKNLNDVTSVIFHGSTEALTIVSKTATSLVVTFPATTIKRAVLDITNAAGTTPTTQEFVNLDLAYKIFTDGYDQGFQNASWGSDAFISTTIFKTGTSSVGKTFAGANWHQLGFGWNSVTNDNFKYLSFWVRGGTKDYNLWISSAASPGGFASFNEEAKVAVPAGVWTYYKLPVSSLNLWSTTSTFNQIGWRVQGPDADETFYLDDVIFVQ